MIWFQGNIAQAVSLSKTKNAVFVVYCEGTDELSTSLTSVINDVRISSKLESENFVAIKIQSDSEAYTQFAQIYKLVPLPSLFFIGKSGAPLEIITGITKTVDELQAKIDGVLQMAGLKSTSSSSNASASLIESEKSSQSEETEVVCEGGVCYNRPKQSKENVPTSSSASPDETAINENDPLAEDKLKRAKELIERKRKEKEEEDGRLAKERELQRRRIGQDLQSFKQRQEESEMKKLQEERKRDKIEEQAVRKRVLEQIAQDKAERAQRFTSSATATSKTVENEPSVISPPLVSDNSIARIQFKKPDGETEIKTFGSSETFGIIRTFVEENVIVASGIREFALATTFPRKEFTSEDDAKTLLELNLVPSSVILILPLDKAPSRKLPIQASYDIFGLLSTIFWGMVNPLLATLSYVRTLIFSRNRNNSGNIKRASEEELSPNDGAKKRNLRYSNPPRTEQPSGETSSAYRRVGGSNIHRLNDRKDSDDENNTWNGNSTQQQ